MAGGAIDLDEVALPEVLDPRGVEGKHSRARCSWYVQGKRAGEAASMANAAQTRQRPSRAVNCWAAGPPGTNGVSARSRSPGRRLKRVRDPSEKGCTRATKEMECG